MMRGLQSNETFKLERIPLACHRCGEVMNRRQTFDGDFREESLCERCAKLEFGTHGNGGSE
jgi:formylmethanofuran dehydrogenase subunit E